MTGEPQHTLWDLLLNAALARGLLTNLQSNTNDHTGASKRERSFTQENKYNFQAGPLKPCMSWVMKTIDYLIYPDKKKKKTVSKGWWRVESGCCSYLKSWCKVLCRVPLVQCTGGSNRAQLRYERRFRKWHECEYRFCIFRPVNWESVCVCAECKLERHKGRRACAGPDFSPVTKTPLYVCMW